MNQSKRAAKVFPVARTIEEFTFHSNLLALNAAVAAASGGSGSDLEVVADTVRDLSRRHSAAAVRFTETAKRTDASAQSLPDADGLSV